MHRNLAPRRGFGPLMRSLLTALTALLACALLPAAAQARVVVVATGDASATLVDVRTNAVVAKVGVPGRSRAVTASPNGDRAYVAAGNRVVAIDLAARRVAGGANLPSAASALAVSPDGMRLYAARGRAIAVLDAAGPALRGSISLPGKPRSLAASQDGTRAIAVLAGSKVTLVDLVAGRAIRTLRVSGAAGADFDNAGRAWISGQVMPASKKKAKKKKAKSSAVVRPGGRLVPLTLATATLGPAVGLGTTGGGGGVAI